MPLTDLSRVGFLPLLGGTLTLLVVGCGKSDPSEQPDVDLVAGLPPLRQELLALPAAPQTETVFARVSAKASGLDFDNPLDLGHPLKRLYAGGYAAGGIAIGDLDGDQQPDVYVVSGPEKNGLFRQSGSLQFEDITAAAGVDGGDAWGAGVALADIDNDGDLDIYVCNYDAPNLLYINDGKATFEERAAEFGLDLINASFMPSFSDYDRDGDLDLYVVTNRFYREGGFPDDPFFVTDDGVQVKAAYAKWYSLGKRKTLRTLGRRDVLYRNDGIDDSGNVIFKDVSGYAGDIGVDPGHGLAATWWDYNEDGYPDLYVSNDGEDPDRFYHNNQDGTFAEIGAAILPFTPWHSRGAAAADLNQDGLLDLFCVDDAGATLGEAKRLHADAGSNFALLQGTLPRQTAQNTLFLNAGAGRFEEVARLCGLAGTQASWAPLAADFDHDGYTDLLVTNGAARPFSNADLQTTLGGAQTNKTVWDLYEAQGPLNLQNRAFANEGDLHFRDVSQAWGFNHIGMSYAGAHGDLDGDGDLDLIVANLDDGVHLYRNDSEAGARLTVRLIGSQSNRWGIGARIVATVNKRAFVRTLNPYAGFLASHDPLVHLCVGDAISVDHLKVRWPSGVLQTFNDVKVNQRLTIVEPADQDASPEESAVQPLFVRDESLETIKHTESPYNDYAQEPLLARQLSTVGPGLALGDMNHDGLDDIYLGGSARWSGQFWQRKSSGFRQALTEAFVADESSEDQMPLFFDANSDGHLDIYVVSGGVEAKPGANALQDRLYIGNSRGGFEKATGVLPPLRDSGSAVAAADFDQDDDLDLFIGGRTEPGRYPDAAPNRLLVNQHEPGKPWRFLDATSSHAPGVGNSGVVTSALWSDVDNDGWIDLVVAHDWGTVKWFRNQQGTLTETSNTGLESLTGRWSSITPGDVDNDGDIDYAVMNLGLNTVYHAQPETPMVAYQGDFGSNSTHFVEAIHDGDALVTVIGRARMVAAIPSLARRFPTYASYGSATAEQLLTTPSRKIEIRTLQSGILLNNGAGKFTFRSLPREAQLAPSTGAVLMDLDGDFKLDLVLGQNVSSTAYDVGPMNGGIGKLLRGRGDGTFLPVSPRASGVNIPGPATALVITDLNGDEAPDILVAQNDREVIGFTRERSSTKWCSIRFHGSVRNSFGIGARVEVSWNGKRRLTTELYAGHGYLSQTSTRIFFPRPSGGGIGQIKVTWPDGEKSQESFGMQESATIIRRGR